MFENKLSFLFSLGMAFFFLYSFFFPAETGYWLVQSGLPILIIEFMTPFAVLSASELLGKRTGLPDPNKIVMWAWFLGGLSGVVYFCFTSNNLWLGAYFIASFIVKFFDIRSKPDMLSEGQVLRYSIPLFLVSALAGIFVSGFFQIQNPSGQIAFWGFFYFVATSLVAFTGWTFKMVAVSPNR